MADSSTPAPGTPEHDAAMAQKVDDSAAAALAASGESGLPPAPKPQERPADVPEEFWDAEQGEVKTTALLKALAAAKGAGQESPKADDAAPSADAAKAAVESKGVDYTALQTEYAEKGALSTATYAKLAEVGFDKAVVDSFIAGQSALTEQRVSRAHAEVGGEENFSRIQEWAKTGLTKAEVETFNKAVEGSDEELLQAVRSLKASYEKVNGRQPHLMGGTPPAASGPGYESSAQMVADMRNPLYEKDPAFRAKVQARVASTTAF